jgi:hypothetical protein
MRNLLLLALVALLLYWLYTSGTAARLVESVTGPAGTPGVKVTIHPVVIESSAEPGPGAATLAPSQAAPTLAPTLDPLTPTPVPTDTPLPPPTIIIPEPPPTLAPQPTPTASANFTLSVETPRDGETLRYSPALVIGQTQPNALVSVNDTVGFANAEGRFSLSAPLREGPNILEVLASNAAGEQVFVIITVLYQP